MWLNYSCHALPDPVIRSTMHAYMYACYMLHVRVQSLNYMPKHCMLNGNKLVLKQNKS